MLRRQGRFLPCPKELNCDEHSKHRKENQWKIRKQTQQPHGKIKSLAAYSDEYDAQQSGR
ncbi:DUF6254 family protein [Paenibacillus tianmuensis]|uniref:DUF6254 family protein n=1 Tax=Paenibacillus tianmuensis TaxID=624147 RepID=UPI003CCB7557